MPGAHQVAQLAGHPVAGHGIPDTSADDEADRGVRHAGLNVYDQRSVPTALSTPHHGVELDAAAQPDRCGQH
jgi:hypothetical protein